MHYEILGIPRNHKCSIELIQADLIEIKRKPNQIFHFTDVDNFLNCLIGHSSCVIHQGKDSENEGKWKVYFWEASYDQQKGTFGSSAFQNILPYSSLAILTMDSEYWLQGTLEARTKETRRWIDLWRQIQNIASKIRRLDNENKFADADRFEYMTVDELKEKHQEMQEEYSSLTRKPTSEV